MVESAQGAQIPEAGEAPPDGAPAAGEGDKADIDKGVQGTTDVDIAEGEEGGTTDAQVGGSVDVDAFVQKWDLDERSRGVFEGLPPKDQAKVIAGFSPAADTQNMNARFMVWVRTQVRVRAASGQKRGGARAKATSAVEGATDEQLSAFTDRWSLDAESAKLLRDSSPVVQKAVIAGFAPRSGTLDVGSKFAAYVKSQAKLQQAAAVGAGPHAGMGMRAIGAAPPVVGPPAPPGLSPTNPPNPPCHDPVDDFLQQWGLSDKSRRVLHALPEPLQRSIIAGFAPGKNVRNPDAKFQAYVQSKTAAQPGPGQSGPPAGATGQPVPWNVLRHFSERWSLDAQALDELARLPPDTCAEVVTNFNPPSGTRNVNAVLRAYAQRRLQAARAAQPFSASMRPQQLMGPSGISVDTRIGGFAGLGSGGGPAGPRLRVGSLKGAIGGGGASSAPPDRRGAAKGASKGQSQVEPPAAPSLDEPTAAFVERWGISLDGQRVLAELPEDLRKRALEEFAPGEDTADASARLKSFIRTKILPKKAPTLRPGRSTQTRSLAIGSARPPARKPPPGLRRTDKGGQGSSGGEAGANGGEVGACESAETDLK